MQENNTYNITAYNLFDFLLEVQKAVQKGFVLSDDNKNFPQAYISLYTCTLVKEDKFVVEDATIESIPATESDVEVLKSLLEETKVEYAPVKEVTIADVVSNQEKKTTGRKPKGAK